MTKPFLPKNINEAKWHTSASDVYVLLNSRTIQTFMTEVVMPALAAVDAQIERIDRSANEAERVFAGADMRAVKHKTIEAFLLSIHSIWERQLRRWLSSAARDKGFDVSHIQKRIVRGPWADLKVALEEVARLPLTIFDSGPHLDLAHLLANACRHGDGGSAEDLSKQWPELWPEFTALPSPVGLFPSKAFQSFELARLNTDYFSGWSPRSARSGRTSSTSVWEVSLQNTARQPAQRLGSTSANSARREHYASWPCPFGKRRS